MNVKMIMDYQKQEMFNVKYNKIKIQRTGKIQKTNIS